jgi:large subunit ribosomal protein L10
MALTKQKKGEILGALTDSLGKTTSAVFVGFKGLTVAEVNELRAALKQEGVKYGVVKKTLLKKALSEKGYEGDMPELPGEVAMAHLAGGEDLTAPARALQTFVKKFKEKLAFLGGVLEGKYLSQSEITVVAQIPATPVLRGMFVNVINSPLQRFAIALSEVAKTKNA